MSLTDYQAKYFAHELTRRFPPDSVEKVTVAYAGAQVDLNPHQIDAALFAFNSPLSRGALLADEVGLGKTIEAGLVLSQKWAERKRCILVITPASLRKQWYQELTKKSFCHPVCGKQSPIIPLSNKASCVPLQRRKLSKDDGEVAPLKSRKSYCNVQLTSWSERNDGYGRQADP
ncbi:MAG: DEAD/DEAH box helicase [Desulfosarcina sp.]|nr:DEAD/DEAH box helicase [Desulfosarcina sp.]